MVICYQTGHRYFLPFASLNGLGHTLERPFIYNTNGLFVHATIHKSYLHQMNICPCLQFNLNEAKSKSVLIMLNFNRSSHGNREASTNYFEQVLELERNAINPDNEEVE